MTHLAVFHHLSFSPFFFSPQSIPDSSSSTLSHLTPLRSLLPLLSSRCCHANFPGDSVVMDTVQQGRSADVWCCSGVCTNRSPVCALSFPDLSCLFFFFFFFLIHPFIPSPQSVCSLPPTTHSCSETTQTLFLKNQINVSACSRIMLF